MSQQDLYGLGYSNKNKKFKFVLSSTDYGRLEQHYSPVGWADSELTFTRDDTYKSVIESYSTNELTFVKDAREYIQTAYEARGIDYEITIRIKILQNSTFQYVDYFVGRLDLSTYKIDSTGVTAEVIPTGFQNTVLNRDSIEVDLFNTKFIGGGENSMEQISGMPTTLKLPPYSALQDSDWGISGIREKSSTYNHYVPMDLNASEFDVSQNQEFDLTVPFFVSSQDINVNVSAQISLSLISLGLPAKFTYQAVLRKNGTPVNSYYFENPGEVSQFDIDFTIDEDLELLVNDELSLTATTTTNKDTYLISYENSALSMSAEIGVTLGTVTVASFLAFEWTARVIQLISGNADPLESEELGRTDSSPVSYVSDGDSSLTNMTNGRLIREFPESQVTLNGSLKGTFKTLNGIKNIGLGFENDKVRIEKESYFFDISDNPSYPTESQKYQVNQILDVSSFVTDEIIEKEVLPDWYANEAKSGYSKFEYETIQGLKEFNTKSNYAIPIKAVKSTLDLTSDFRADTQGVNKQREKPYSDNSTEDVNGDNNVFLFDSKRDAPWTAKTNEDFDFVGGGIDPEQNYNLDFTPRRNLERHGNRFSSMQIDIGKEIQWMQSDKNTKLVTQKTGEDAKPENGDIVIGSLDVGYWIPEAYIFQAPVDETSIASIQANPRGVIKVGTDKYGWILQVQTNGDNKKGEFRLLRVDLNNVKVVV